MKFFKRLICFHPNWQISLRPRDWRVGNNHYICLSCGKENDFGSFNGFLRLPINMNPQINSEEYAPYELQR
jgi:hypothetical protein